MRGCKWIRQHDIWSKNKFSDGVFTFGEHPVRLQREKDFEGKYVLITSEKENTAQGAVQQYKELMEVERHFRSLKDILAMRPI
jgi:transposase